MSEARRDGELFGEEGIRELIGRVRDRPVDDLLHQLVDAALNFGGLPNQDDIAAIALRLPRDDVTVSESASLTG